MADGDGRARAEPTDRRAWLRDELRSGYAHDVRERLGAFIRAASALVTTGAVGEAARVASAAHLLASGAALVGDDELCRCGRACERMLLSYVKSGTALPPDMRAAVADQVETMTLLLAPWLVEDPAA